MSNTLSNKITLDIFLTSCFCIRNDKYLARNGRKKASDAV
jgi:hypothetical protein